MDITCGSYHDLKFNSNMKKVKVNRSKSNDDVNSTKGDVNNDVEDDINNDVVGDVIMMP